MGSGSAGFLRIYSDRFGTISIALPPIDSQEVRAKEATRLTAELAISIKSTLREIELLEEYRDRLIADIVTGQRQAPADAPALGDVDPDELDAALAAGSADDDVGDEE